MYLPLMNEEKNNWLEAKALLTNSYTQKHILS